MLVLLDLEDTLIHTWEQPDLLPHLVARVQGVLAQYPDASVGLMSWAVYHAKDLATFRTQLQAPLEAVLGRSFDPTWTLSMDDWARAIFACSGKLLSREDLFDLFSKLETFLFLARHLPAWKDETVILLDDAVPETFLLQIPERGTRALAVNIRATHWPVPLLEQVRTPERV